MGIQPDIIVCRTEHELDRQIRDKIALFCNVPKKCVLQNLDVEYLYEVLTSLISAAGSSPSKALASAKPKRQSA